MDQYTPVTAATTFGELIDKLENVRGQLQCGKRVHKENVAILN
jgi:hypothetical protein